MVWSGTSANRASVMCYQCTAMSPSQQSISLRSGLMAFLHAGMERHFFSATFPQFKMASDVSGSWGYGAWHDHWWFQFQWEEWSASLPIMVKELLPIVLSCSGWGQQWGHALVHCHCDNQAVVACLHSRTCRDAYCMHMLRTLASIKAHHIFTLWPE